MLTEVTFSVGCHIDKAATLLVEAARTSGSAFGEFNDIRLEANSLSAPENVIEFYNSETARRSEAYKNSPAGKAAERERESCRSAAQAIHDMLMQKLPSLDFSDDVAVLDWLCAMQEPSDHIGIIIRRETIVGAFESRGFVESANCGSDYRKGNRENMFRYLVGQAINGLKSGPAIHPILHKFVGEWKAQFAQESKGG